MRNITNGSSITRRVLLGGAVAALAAPYVASTAHAAINLKFGSVEPQNDNAPFNADDWFCKEVTSRSNGELTIKHFPAGQLGAQRDLVEGLTLGTVDIVGSSTALISSYVNEMAIFDLPYMFVDKSKLYGLLDGPDGQDLMTERMESKGLRGLGFYDMGVRDIFNNTRRVRTIEDLKGLKIRVEENPIRVATFKAMGAQATPMAFTEVYNGIQQGVIDGFENSPLVYVTNKFNETAKYVSRTGHFMTPGIRSMSKSGWETLPKDMQALVETVMAEAVQLERKQWSDSEGKILDTIKSLNVTVDEVEKDGFREAVQPFVQAELAKYDKGWVEKVTKAR